MIRVAIYEDNADLRDALTALVRGAAGMEAVGAFAACDTVEADTRACRPDVVIMDIGLPGVSGIEGVRRLRAAFPRIGALMLTVYEDESRIFHAICAGAAGYLLKSAKPDRIVEAVREVHAGGAPMTPSVARRVLALLQNRSPEPPPDCRLSDREREVLAALVDGLSYKMIADRCEISIDTVRTHIKHIYEKLHVHSKSEAVVKALRDRLV